MLDYHMHSTFSEDGTMTMEEACRQAIKVGLKEIAITDHMDIDLPENIHAFQIKDMYHYVEEINKVKVQFQDRLKVKAGIELGLQDWTLDQSTALTVNFPLDFVIASVHIVDGEDPYFGIYFNSRDKEKSYTDYYRTILQLIEEFDDFNVLGHLDYFRRYSPYEYQLEDRWIGKDLVEAILKVLIRKGKGLELNTSGLTHSSKQPHPHPDILKWFRELGGEIVTIGSDAHSVQEVGYENQRALEWLKYAGFDYVSSFTDMKPEFIRI